MNSQTTIPALQRDDSYITNPLQQPFPARVCRILVADDNESVRYTIRTALARAGFEVNVACDGGEAWKALRQEQYDMLITDNEMPRLTGIKLIERIRDAGMSLPIIMATASFSMSEMRDYAEHQIAALIPKPFDICELLTIVRIALRVLGEDADPDPATLQQLRANSQPIRYRNQPNPELCKPYLSHPNVGLNPSP